MSVRAGDIAKETGPYECIECEEIALLQEGDEVPVCSCGGLFYLERMSLQAGRDEEDQQERRTAA